MMPRNSSSRYVSLHYFSVSVSLTAKVNLTSQTALVVYETIHIKCFDSVCTFVSIIRHENNISTAPHYAGSFMTCPTVILSAVFSYTVQISKKRVFDVRCVLFSLPLLPKIFLSLKVILWDLNLFKVSVLIRL